MAFFKEYNDKKTNTVIPNCYWKITGIMGGKNKLQVKLSCFKDRNSAEENKNRFCDLNFDIVPNLNSTMNFIAQGYAHIKALPQFKGAVDA